MTSFVLAVVVALLALVAVKALYGMFISFALAEDPRADELHMVDTDDRWQVRLARYRPEGNEGEPVLVVPGVCGNQFSLTSPEGDSLVDALREHGFDCWVIDLRGSRSSQAPLGKSRFSATFDDYLQYDLPAAIDFIRRTTGFRQVHWVGHSMGGMLLYAYELMHTDKFLASGTTLAAPPGFANVKLRRPNFQLSLLSAIPGICEIYLRAVAPLIPLVAPLVPSSRLNTPIDPISWPNMHKRVNAAVFFNMLEMIPPRVADTLSLAAAKNQLRVNDGQADYISGLKTLQVSLLCVYAANDPFIPQDNAHAFFEALPKNDKEILTLSKANGCEQDYGHVDVVLGANGRNEVYGRVANWLDAHSSVGKLSTVDSEGLVNAKPGGDASWRKALRRAADVMSDFAVGTVVKTSPRKTAAKSVKAKAAPKKKKSAAKKTASKKKAPTKKSSAKKKAAAKKPAAKKKTAAKKKAAAK